VSVLAGKGSRARSIIDSWGGRLRESKVQSKTSWLIILVGRQSKGVAGGLGSVCCLSKRGKLKLGALGPGDWWLLNQGAVMLLIKVRDDADLWDDGSGMGLRLLGFDGGVCLMSRLRKFGRGKGINLGIRG
jgi:hypothetical protein